MTHVNELKYAELGGSGQMQCDEYAWLITQGGTDGKAINEMWLEVFAAQGVSATSFNEAAVEFLTDQGLTGSLPEMWHQFWTDIAGGGVDSLLLETGDNLLLETGTFDALVLE